MTALVQTAAKSTILPFVAAMVLGLGIVTIAGHVQASALHDATGVRAHPNSIGKFLRKLGYTHKKSRWWPPSAVAPR